MALTYRGDGALVSWVNTIGIPRLKGDLVVDNLLVGYALEDIMPLGQEMWIRNRKPLYSIGTICRTGVIEYSLHLQHSVKAWQPAYFNPGIDMVSDSPGAISSLPRPAAGNIGTTTVSPIAVGDDTLAETWILECISPGGFSMWRVAGSTSGTLSDQIPNGQWWTDPKHLIGLRIDVGSIAPAEGDRFTFLTNRARTKIGLFQYSYPASSTRGVILLDCKTPLKTDYHGKMYR